MEIRHTYVNDVPVFVVSNRIAGAAKAFGAVPVPEKSCYVFPAFPPFLEDVVDGLRKLKLRVSRPETKTLDAWRQEVSSFALPTKSFDHQLDGLAELLHNYRWALQWEMGTGKSKVVVDALMLLRMPTLILGSRVAISNWPGEFQKHSDGSFKILALDGHSIKKKKQQLKAATEMDIVLATYDVARLYGVPTLYQETAKLFKQANVIPNIKLRDALKNLNDEPLQLRFAQEVLRGRNNADAIAEIESITQALPTCLAHLPYKIIIADESHRIKHIQSRRTAHCLQLSAKAQRRYLLTGTMSDGDPRSVYPQLQFLAPYLMPEAWTTFCKKYLVMAPHTKHVVVQYKNVDVINQRVGSVSSVKLLDDCVDLPKQLPPVTVNYTLSSEQRKAYNLAAEEFKLCRDVDNEEIDLAHSALVIAKQLQICSGFVYVPEPQDEAQLLSSQDLHSKLPAPKRDTQRYPTNPKLESLVDWLEDALEDPRTKLIIWANFIAELDDIEAALNKAKYCYVRVDGSNTNRIHLCRDYFQNEPECRIYLAQETTGESITLTAAKYMMYYSRSWNPDTHRQSKKRNYRIGQTQRTCIYNLVAEGTTEEQQLLALEYNITLATLLTHNHECVLCGHYKKCLAKGVKPWDNECVLDKDPHRVVTKPTALKED